MSWAQSASAQSSMAYPMSSSSWHTSPMLSSTASDEYDANDFDQPPLTSDSRLRPHRIVPPSHITESESPPRVAISVSSNTEYITKRQDVRPVLNPSASFRPPSPAPRFNAFPDTPLERPLSSFPTPDNVPINTDNTSLRTPPVFPSTTELAAHYGLPPESSPLLPVQFIANLSINQPQNNRPRSADTAAAPASGAFPSATTMQAIQDLLGNAPSIFRYGTWSNSFAVLTASPEFQSLGDSFDPTSPLFEESGASPLFEDSPSFDIDNYLTSPMETPYDDFATSPADDSPFSDYLTTPVLPMASDEDMLTGPLIDDGGYGDSMDLFGGLSSYYEVPAEPAPKLPSTTKLYTISPSTPALDSIDPATTVFPPKPKSTTPVPASPAVDAAPTTTRKRAAVTGTRKNLKPEALIPLEAPTQKRTYITPSATSRKAVPAVIQRKRLHSSAFAGADDEEVAELSPTASEMETIEYKRRQNTLAARKSRKRKLEHQRELEEQIDQLQDEVQLWKKRALTLQDTLISNGVPFTPWED
ncbi:hypothetical protein MSAN_01560300 [Mycena sanguinolenta]|uniref:BZIP domain-containing protein n=1 Tax=Mycena sanguinolenta TaxID=230812 RepID=A0A8H6XZN0_9AGAR|nr:hypothetical protein MSAN_01560300 [Mycena sanguinolenta]